MVRSGNFTDDTIRNRHVFETAQRRRSELNAVAVGLDDAVGDSNIFNRFVITVLQTDSIVVALDDAVGHAHVTALDIQSVVINQSETIDLNPVDVYPVAFQIVMRPIDGVFERKVFDQHILAINEQDGVRPSGAVVHAASCPFGATSVNGAGTFNTHVMHILSHDKPHLTPLLRIRIANFGRCTGRQIIIDIGVFLGRGATSQDRHRRQVYRDVAPQKDRSAQKRALWKVHQPARLGALVNGFLDGLCAVSFSVGKGPVFQHVIRLGS